MSLNLFDPSWLIDLEEVVFNIDDKLKILMPKAYMDHKSGNPELARSPKHPFLIIRDNILLFREWPRMEASMQLLL